MADEAAVTAAVEAPVAAVEAAPVVDGNYDVEDPEPIIAPDENAETHEPVLDEAAPVETKAEKVVRLAELRKKDKPEEFDEDLLEKIVAEHGQNQADMASARELYATDPDFKAAWLKATIAKGYQATADEKAFLAGREKPVQAASAVADPNAPKRYAPDVVRKFVADECKKMEAAGHPVTDILEYRDGMIDRWITKPEREDAKAAADKESAERAGKEKTAAEAAKIQSDAHALRASGAAAAKAYGDIWVKDPSLACGYRCKDAAVLGIVAQLTGFPLDEATTMALAKLKRLQPTAKPKQASAVRPVIQNQKVAQKAKVDPKYDVE